MKIDEQAIDAYINTPKTVEFYKEAFEKYTIAGVDQFKWHWSWWAFGGGVFYLLYRKLYLEAAIYLLVFSILINIPALNLLAWIVSGGVLPYLVYRRYKKIKKQVKKNIENPNKQLDVLKELGGVNKWAIWIAVLINGLFLGAVLYTTMAVLAAT